MTPLPSELQKLFEKQMAEEYREALFYLQQTVYFEQLGLTGFSKWCKNQYTEELAHATAIMNYLLARGVNAHIPSINVIDKTYHDAEAIFKAMLALEVSSTESINKIHRKSIALNDHGTFSFAQILVKKQIKEQYLIARIVKRIHFVQGDPAALLDIDEELESSTINEGVISANYQVLNRAGIPVEATLGADDDGYGGGVGYSRGNAKLFPADKATIFL